jgi:hypothetical protein
MNNLPMHTPSLTVINAIEKNVDSRKTTAPQVETCRKSKRMKAELEGLTQCN